MLKGEDSKEIKLLVKKAIDMEVHIEYSIEVWTLFG